LLNTGLVARYTSFIAIDAETKKPLDESWLIEKSRDIPVELPHRWLAYGHGGVSYAPAMRMMLSSQTLLVEVRSAPIEHKMKKKKLGIFSCLQCFKVDNNISDENYEDGGVKIIKYENINPITERITPAIEPRQIQALNDDEKLIKLVDSQNFNGGFRLEMNIAELLDTTVDDLKGILQQK